MTFNIFVINNIDSINYNNKTISKSDYFIDFINNLSNDFKSNN